jgi:predicted peroxiredoxin
VTRGFFFTFSGTYLLERKKERKYLKHKEKKLQYFSRKMTMERGTQKVQHKWSLSQPYASEALEECRRSADFMTGPK